MKITKQYIQDNLLTKINGLDSNKTKLIKETSEELYLIYHNLEVPKCECGNKTKFFNFKKGYQEFCTIKCSANSLLTSQKKAQTCLKNYGVEHALQSKEIQDNKNNTCLERYGDENYNNREMYKATNLKNHGVENPMQTGNYDFGYKHKDYKYPSGKIIKVQGFEPQLLDELILIYNEDEILTDRKDMPEFWYINDQKNHRYFPDVYIPKTGTIYEVKSDYTLDESKKNGIFKLKKQSVINAGYTFKLKLY